MAGTGYAHNFVVVEGDITGTELPYFEGMKDAKMPIVKNIGKNLFNPNIIGDSGQYIRNDMGSLVQDNTSKYTVGHICVQPNTKYYLYVKGLQRVYFLDNNKNWISRTGVLYQQGTQTHTTNTNFTTGANCYHIQIQYRVDELDLTNATLVEYGDNNPHVEHKENSIYITQGEIPITSEMMEQGGFSSNNPTGDGSYEKMKYGEENANYLKRLRSKDLIPVKPNTTYQINANSVGGQLMYSVYQWNGNREFMDGSTYGTTYSNIDYTTPLTFTTHGDARYIHLLYKKSNDSKITVGEYDWSQFHMYELDSTINLRSLPNGVKDELNLLTGEYIQRVGEVVLDGSEDEGWNLNTCSNDVEKRFTISISDMKIETNESNSNHLLCNKYNTVSFKELYTQNKNGIASWNYGATISIKNGMTDLATFKQHLQQNPVTVQYELAEPITSHVRLVSNNQEREVGVKLPNGVCNTYNPSTGITTVRVGFIEFDGSEDWTAVTTDGELQQAVNGAIHMYGVWTAQPLPNARTANPTTEARIPGVCDSFSFKNKALDSTNEEFYFISHTGRFNMNIARTKLTGSNVSHLKEYLSQNPIKLWYELKYPQIQPDIVLPNGVHDEYNPETGVYTKRVGFIEFDGSADENWEKRVWDTQPLYSMFNIPSTYAVPTQSANNVNIISNSLASDFEQWNNGGESITVFKSPSRISITYDATKISTVDGLRTHLSQNPLKVWYELATPITYQLTPYFGLPQPYAYEDGYIIMESVYPETTLPPEFNYKLLANRTGQVMQNNRKLQEHTTRLSNLEALIIEATIESLFDRELQMFELELMDIQLIDLGE